MRQILDPGRLLPEALYADNIQELGEMVDDLMMSIRNTSTIIEWIRTFDKPLSNPNRCSIESEFLQSIKNEAEEMIAMLYDDFGLFETADSIRRSARVIKTSILPPKKDDEYIQRIIEGQWKLSQTWEGEPPVDDELPF